jgi:hypothetical protein
MLKIFKMVSELQITWYRPKYDNTILGGVVTAFVNIFMIMLLSEGLFIFVSIVAKFWTRLDWVSGSNWANVYEQDLYYQIFVFVILITVILAIIYAYSFGTSGVLRISSEQQVNFELDNHQVETFAFEDLTNFCLKKDRFPFTLRVIGLSNWLTFNNKKKYYLNIQSKQLKILRGLINEHNNR